MQAPHVVVSAFIFPELLGRYAKRRAMPGLLVFAAVLMLASALHVYLEDIISPVILLSSVFLTIFWLFLPNSRILSILWIVALVGVIESALQIVSSLIVFRTRVFTSGSLRTLMALWLGDLLTLVWCCKSSVRLMHLSSSGHMLIAEDEKAEMIGAATEVYGDENSPHKNTTWSPFYGSSTSLQEAVMV